jgi:hypothetical protein
MSDDATLLFIIGSGDEADQIVHAGSRLIVAGTSDLTKLMPGEPHHRLHVTRNYFRQGRQADLSGSREPQEAAARRSGPGDQQARRGAALDP